MQCHELEDRAEDSMVKAGIGNTFLHISIRRLMTFGV